MRRCAHGSARGFIGRFLRSPAGAARPESAERAPLPRWLRRISSGVGFSGFGLGALVLVFIAFPLMRLATRDPVLRTRRARALIQRSFRLFVRLLVVIGGVRVGYLHRERLRASGPMLIVANHPTLIDVCLLVSEVPDAECVVKKDAWSNPFLRGVVRAADYVPNDGGEQLVTTCVERLRAGRTLILFPEGSRSPKGGLRSFKRGAARIALQAACPVMLVDIACRPPFLGKGDPWYQVPRALPCYTVTAHAPAPVRPGQDGGVEHEEADDVADPSEASRARRLTCDWRRGFEERLGHG
jgi:1-acyl-sn-glycerol-3-phosphate acyltransferase